MDHQHAKQRLPFIVSENKNTGLTLNTILPIPVWLCLSSMFYAKPNHLARLMRVWNIVLISCENNVLFNIAYVTNCFGVNFKHILFTCWILKFEDNVFNILVLLFILYLLWIERKPNKRSYNLLIKIKQQRRKIKYWILTIINILQL